MDVQLSIPVLLAGVAIVIAIIGLWLVIRLSLVVKQIQGFIREIKRDQQCQGTSILALQGAMKSISQDVIAHGQVQSSVKRMLEHLADQQNQMQLREVDEGLYPQAIRLIQSGRNREEVQRLFSLTDSEADLLFSLHVPGVIATKDSSPMAPKDR